MDKAAPARVAKGRLAVIASGDFAFNLYWQSVMLFLLFHYTEALGLPVAAAATIYMLASIWDGVANFAAGVAVDRGWIARGYRAILLAGSVPLALSFVLAYAPPPTEGAWGAAVLLTSHMLFRTAYAALNVPYLAMCARVSPDPGDRALVAGMRMLFGTAAAVLVALGTAPLGARVGVGADPTRAYLGAAIPLACAATAILLIVGASFRDAAHEARPPPPTFRAAVGSLLRNRAFVTLNGAMVLMIVAVTVLSKAVLYYYKYVIGDEAAGQLALASMSLAGAAAIPAWMLVGRLAGLRAQWLIAAAAAMLALAAFAAAGIDEADAMRFFLIVMQMLTVGLHFAFWAMLPNVIEYGERETGYRVEGVLFGLAALLQRVAIGVATAIFGLSLSAVGFVPNAEQSAAALSGLRATVALPPLLFLGLSWAAMLACPLGRGLRLPSSRP